MDGKGKSGPELRLLFCVFGGVIPPVVIEEREMRGKIFHRCSLPGWGEMFFVPILHVKPSFTCLFS